VVRILGTAVVMFMVAKCSAQELFVHPDLSILKGTQVDRLACGLGPGREPMEVISPAVLRNTWNTFVVGFRHRAGAPFGLQVGQNPAGSFSVRVYRGFPHLEDQSLLEPVEFPLRARLPEGSNCAVFFMDVWVPADATPGRVKLEVAVWASADGTNFYWTRHPMEVRVSANRAPDSSLALRPKSCDLPLETLLDVAAGAARGRCAAVVPECFDQEDVSALGLLERNLLQDLSIQKSLAGEGKVCGPVEAGAFRLDEYWRMRKLWSATGN
jgi:hypothetical protein